MFIVGFYFDCLSQFLCFYLISEFISCCKCAVHTFVTTKLIMTGIASDLSYILGECSVSSQARGIGIDHLLII